MEVNSGMNYFTLILHGTHTLDQQPAKSSSLTQKIALRVLLATITEQGARNWALSRIRNTRNGNLGPSPGGADAGQARLRASPSRAQVARPQLRIAKSGLGIERRVLRFGNGNGLWRGQDSALSVVGFLTLAFWPEDEIP